MSRETILAFWNRNFLWGTLVRRRICRHIVDYEPCYLSFYVQSPCRNLSLTRQMFSRITVCFSYSTPQFWTEFWHHKYGNCYMFNRGKDANNRKTDVKTSSIPGHEGGKRFFLQILVKLEYRYTWKFNLYKDYNSRKWSNKI